MTKNPDFNPARQPEGIKAGGQFATAPKAPGTAELTGPASSTPNIEAMAAARDVLRQAWDEAEDTGAPETALLDQQMQHASVQLAAAAVLRDYPTAETLVMRENEDGEKQYDLLAVRDADGADIVNSSTNDGWTREPVAGDHGVQMEELTWMLNTEDDTWAAGIAEIHSDKYNGKTAAVDLRAALHQPMPTELAPDGADTAASDEPAEPQLTPRQKTAAAADRLADLHEIRDRAARQAAMVKELSQHASVQLLAASILEKHPTAAKLNLRDDDDGNNTLKPVSVMDADGLVLEYGDTPGNLFEQYVPGGMTSYAEIIQDLDTKEPAWAEGVATVKTNKYQTYVNVNLQAALDKPAPVFDEMNNPRTKPLTRNEQDDLVEAAFYGLPEIEDAAEEAEDYAKSEQLQQFHKRLNETLTRR